jgi:hypothetical protein
MTSALLYATAMGLTSFFYGPTFQVISNDRHYAEIDYTAHHRDWEAQFETFFRFPDADPAMQREAVDRELGGDVLLGADEMRRLLWRSARSSQYRARFGQAAQSKLKSLTTRRKRVSYE